MEANVDVSIVIVSYNVREHLRRLLRSVFTETRGVAFEVFVVDNASKDGTAEMVLKEFPEVNLIANEVNAGFARANNQAIGAAKGKHILLLNPDTELLEDAPSALVGFAEDHPLAAVVGSRILNPDRSLQPSVLRFPDLCSQAFVMLKLHHLFPNLSCLRRYFYADFDYQKHHAVDQVMGSAFLMTRRGREALGGFDGRFFLWFEEVDYCKRAHDAKLEVWYTPVTSVIHHGGQSFSQLFAARRQWYFNASLATYMRKHLGIGAWLLVQFLDCPSLLIAWIVGIAGLKKKKYAP